MFDIVGKRNWYFAFSALLTIPGLIFIALGGLKPSVDFTGGTVFQVRYASEPSADEVQAALVDLGHPEAIVRATDDGWLEIRTEPIDLVDPTEPIPVPSGSVAASPSTTPSASGSPEASASASPTATPVPSPSPGPVIDVDTELGDLEAALEERFGAAAEGSPRSATTVGPIVGADLIRSSAILIIIGEIAIMLYLGLRFGLRFGICAIVALLHDVILVVGLFAMLGFFFGVEFDALFVTALLTIIGFSVHDTIVVFDRIRENRVRHAGEPFGAIVNHSILQTMGRSIITSITVMVTLAALLLLGPPTIRTFTLALLVGVVSGTYSSIFNASQLLVAWHEWSEKRKAGARAAVRPLSR
ncbi:MAG TPA: protein translocase subunit SecF [Candidatus Limnocylindria bacterium]|nr:protein translocase subunit SecF [Candidatus Limnocylindria bacterium]